MRCKSIPLEMTYTIPLRLNKKHMPQNGHSCYKEIPFGQSFSDLQGLIHKWIFGPRAAPGRYAAEVLGPLHLELWRFACDRHREHSEFGMIC